MRFDTLATLVRRAVPAVLLAVLAGCGGGDFVELFVKLITARFVPASVTLSSGASASVDLEVTCDRDGLGTPYGRLGVRVKLDRSGTLPAGVTAVPTGGVTGSDGFSLFPCTGTVSDPTLRVAHIPVVVSAAAGVAAQTIPLNAYIEVEPLLAGEPSKDSTLADLSIHVGGSSASPGR